MNTKKIILAADHAGFALKEYIKSYLNQKGYDVQDVGALALVEGDDYPEYMARAAQMVSADSVANTVAILFGGSGEGEAIVANRYPCVRATVWYGELASPGMAHEIIKKSREHNNSNILSIGARYVDQETTLKAIELWLATPFSGEERHVRRIGEIERLEIENRG